MVMPTVRRRPWSALVLGAALSVSVRSAAAQSTVPPRRVALSISGGISLGSYEAGVLHGLVRHLRAHPDRYALRVLTGASAGAITGLVAGLESCDAAVPPSRSALHDAWVGIGIQDLFDPATVTAVSVFSQGRLEAMADDRLRPLWLRGGPGCRFTLGVVLTDAGMHTPSSSRDPGATRHVALSITRTADGFALATPRPAKDEAPWQGLPSDGDARVDFARVRDAALASAAFPLAFLPRTVALCPHGEPDQEDPGRDTTAPCEAGHASTDLFLDGGVFDNEPIGLARALLAARENGGVEGDGRALVLHVSSGAVTLAEAETPDDALGVVGYVSRLTSGLVGAARGAARSRALRDLPAEQWVSNAGTLPAAGSVLGGFGGFFDRDLREFDFALGLADARRTVRENPGTFEVPFDDGDLGPTDDPAVAGALCIEAVVARAPDAARRCGPPVSLDFLRILAVTLDRLHAHCLDLQLTGQLHRDTFCASRWTWTVPPAVPGIESARRDARAASDGFARFVQRLTAAGFRFDELGARSPVENARQITGTLHQVSAALVRRQPLGQRLLLRPALGILSRSLTGLGLPIELFGVGSGSFQLGLQGAVDPGVRVFVQGALDARWRYSTSDPVAWMVLSPSVALEGIVFSHPAATLRVGARGTLQIPVRSEPFAACDPSAEALRPCAHPVADALVSATLLDVIRFQLALGASIDPGAPEPLTPRVQFSLGAMLPYRGIGPVRR